MLNIQNMFNDKTKNESVYIALIQGPMAERDSQSLSFCVCVYCTETLFLGLICNGKWISTLIKEKGCPGRLAC